LLYINITSIRIINLITFARQLVVPNLIHIRSVDRESKEADGPTRPPHYALILCVSINSIGRFSEHDFGLKPPRFLNEQCSQSIAMNIRNAPPAPRIITLLYILMPIFGNWRRIPKKSPGSFVLKWG